MDAYKVDELAYCTNLAEQFLERYHYHGRHMGLGMKPPLERKENDCRNSTEN